MKTLKKTLCVVLAVVMAVGTLAITASATDFADDADITYNEAVEVLTALGVIDGTDNNRFDPDGTLTRAQGAKIITFALLTPTTADILKASSDPFDDVKASSWMAGSVEYCVDQGIIAGVGNNNFDPNGTLTGVAFAKMFLVALGVEGQFENTTAWDTNVVLAARRAGLDNGMTGFDYYASITREQAAQMALNAMAYTTETANVQYIVKNSSGTVLYTGSNETIAYIYLSQAAGNTIEEATISTGSILSEVYKLTRVDTATSDEFGRPSVKYVQNYNTANAKDLVVVPTNAVATFTTGVSSSQLYTLLGASATIKANGSSVTDMTKHNNSIYINGAISSADVAVATNNLTLGGAGIVTEIYATSTANEYVVVQIVPTLAKVTNVTTTAATRTTGAYTTYTIAGNSYKVFSTTVTNADKDEIVLSGNVAKDGYVMIYDNGTMAYATAATLVTGALTGYTSASNSYTIAGNSYVKSNAAINGSDANGTLNAYNQTATYALDTYGNVVGSVSVTTPTNYIFVLSAAPASYLDSKTNQVISVVEATAIDVNGALVRVRVDDNPLSIATTPGLYSYVTNTDGEYVLSSAAGKTVSQIVQNNITIGSGLYANASTKFFVAVKANNAYTGVASYTGIANVPSLNLPTNVIALDTNNDTIAEIVFVDATAESGANVSYAYLTGSFTSDGTSYTYDAIVNGQTTQLKLASGLSAGLYTITNGTADLIDTAAALDLSSNTAGVYLNRTVSLTYNAGLLMNGSSVLAAVGADIPVYTFANGTVTTGTASGLSSATGSTVVIAVANNAITAIYVVA